MIETKDPFPFSVPSFAEAFCKFVLALLAPYASHALHSGTFMYCLCLNYLRNKN